MRTSLVVAILAFTWVTYAWADASNWCWEIGEGQFAYFGTRSSASDGFDQGDQAVTWPQYWCISTYHQRNVDGWAGDTGFYSSDFRSPLAPVPGASKMWTFYLWGDLSLPAQVNHLEFMWGWSYAAAPAFDKIEYRLTYVRAAEGVTGGDMPVGTSVLLNDYQQGCWGFPVYRTDDGRMGYMFELTARAIPEPTSFLALAGGLAGLGGTALRRRRR